MHQLNDIYIISAFSLRVNTLITERERERERERARERKRERGERGREGGRESYTCKDKNLPITKHVEVNDESICPDLSIDLPMSFIKKSMNSTS